MFGTIVSRYRPLLAPTKFDIHHFWYKRPMFAIHHFWHKWPMFGIHCFWHKRPMLCIQCFCYQQKLSQFFYYPSFLPYPPILSPVIGLLPTLSIHQFWLSTFSSLINLLLSNDRIAELKNRINRSRKIRSARPNKRIVEWAQSSGRSTDTRLLRQ